MGSRDSANDFMKTKNPQNISGSIKKALELIDKLKKSQGNPEMPDSVGPENLANMLSQVAQDFSKESPHDDKEERKRYLREQIAKLKKMLEDLRAIVPQTETLIQEQNALMAEIARLEEELRQLEQTR